MTQDRIAELKAEHKKRMEILELSSTIVDDCLKWAYRSLWFALAALVFSIGVLAWLITR
jgi:hypothetical protein